MTTISNLLTEAASRTTPWKLGCRLCSLVNVTLVGEQEIDGVGAEENDRVLLVGQTNQNHNGPWVVQRNAWVRPVDYNDTQSATLGTTIIVSAGDANSGVYRLTSPQTGDIFPDQTETVWTFVGGFATGPGVPGSNSITNAQLTDMATGTVKGRAVGAGTGDPTDLSTAQQDVLIRTALGVAAGSVGVNSQRITNVANAAAVTDAMNWQTTLQQIPVKLARLATTTNDSLSGLAARDGVTPASGEVVLVKDHATGSSRGLYIALAGAWARTADFNDSADVKSGMLVSVAEGTANGGKVFRLSTPDPITLGSTSLTFVEFGAGGGSSFEIVRAGGTVVVGASGQVSISPATGQPIDMGTTDALNMSGEQVSINSDPAGMTLESATTLGVSSVGNQTQQVGASLKTSSASGSARTETYNGILTVSAGGLLTLGTPGHGTTIQDLGALNLYGNATWNGGGFVNTNCVVGSQRYWQFYYFAAGTPQGRFWFWGPVTPPSAAAEDVAPHVVPASSSGHFDGWLSVRNGSANDKEFHVEFDWNSDGTTVTSRNLVVTANAPQGTIGTVAGDVTLSDSGLTTMVRVASANGFRCILSGISRINA